MIAILNYKRQFSDDSKNELIHRSVVIVDELIKYLLTNSTQTHETQQIGFKKYLTSQKHEDKKIASIIRKLKLN